MLANHEEVMMHFDLLEERWNTRKPASRKPNRRRRPKKN
jgi:hypothetical protein